MWGLFKVLEDSGYATIGQKKAFIPLIKLANTLAEASFLNEGDLRTLSVLETLENEEKQDSVPSHDFEQEEARQHLQQALKILWCHSERLPLSVIAQSALIIYPDLENHFNDENVCLHDMDKFINIFLNNVLSQFNIHQDEFLEKIQVEASLLKPAQEQSDAGTWTQTFASYALAGAAGFLLFKGAQYLKDNDYLDFEMPEITMENAKQGH